jgi:clan AA aspartic protease (TIGR02281 family)
MQPVHALTQNVTLDGVLAARKAALAALHVHPAKTLEVSGLLSGTGMEGAFHSWVAGDDARYEEQIGVREETSLRAGGKVYIINQSGDVRQLRGLLLQRQHTEDFIDTDGFVSHPNDDTFAGKKQLPDGRSVYEIVVAPPGGQPETLDLDAKTLMIDRISYDEEDGTSTEDFYNYSAFAGALVAQREVDSNGDHLYDMVRYTDKILVNRPIPKDTFTVPQSTVIQADAPVTVPLVERGGHYYTRVRVNHRDYTFLVDTGAQAIVLDSHVAQELGLRVQGHLEVAGAQRTGGMGVAQLDSVQIGSGSLPVHIAAVLDLHGATGAYDADGVLGYPFFAAAEVTIDPVANTMTFAKPGTLHPPGTAMNVDVDRQLVELDGKVNGADGRFVVDTGNSTELLIFEPYMHAHPYLVGFQQRHFANDYGVGGAARAVSAIVDELDMGDYRLFNRYASLMLTDQGAFADRFDAGNIGMGVLKNFVVTFDVANAKIYLQRSTAFDDGRYRPRLESSLGPQ